MHCPKDSHFGAEPDGPMKLGKGERRAMFGQGLDLKKTQPKGRRQTDQLYGDILLEQLGQLCK
eukprot:23901-Amphidinium_carterae.1